MKKGVVGGGQKVGVLSFPFFFFSFLTAPKAFSFGIFFDFCRCIFFFALDGKKNEKKKKKKISRCNFFVSF